MGRGVDLDAGRDLHFAPDGDPVAVQEDAVVVDEGRNGMMASERRRSERSEEVNQ
jgi:hypothetical protein